MGALRVKGKGDGYFANVNERDCFEVGALRVNGDGNGKAANHNVKVQPFWSWVLQGSRERGMGDLSSLERVGEI